MNIDNLRNAFARFQMPVSLTSNVNNATYLITVHTTRQQAFARVTLPDNSTQQDNTRGKMDSRQRQSTWSMIFVERN